MTKCRLCKKDFQPYNLRNVVCRPCIKLVFPKHKVPVKLKQVKLDRDQKAFAAKIRESMSNLRKRKTENCTGFGNMFERYSYLKMKLNAALKAGNYTQSDPQGARR